MLSTIARALIDPGFSASFVHEQPPQHGIGSIVVKMLVWKELQELLRIHEVPFGSRCFELKMMQAKLR